MNITQQIKNQIVALGPKSIITKFVLKCYGFFSGYKIIFKEETIEISKDNNCFIINIKSYVTVPVIIREVFEDRFKKIVSKKINNQSILDFSKPEIHCYKHSGLSFLFPDVVEDESIDAYTFKFKPAQGMTVFDIGAHAGSTVYFFSLMVGETGKVYAFEPDDLNRECLNYNVKNKGLDNVEVLDIAIGPRSGKAMFNMDGSMASSLVESSPYPDTGVKKEVAVFTLQDYCHHIGLIPDFIKIDIEGAEVEVIANSLEFLKKNPIHFAFDSYHRTKDGVLTCYALEKLFRSIGYSVESSDKFGEMFTWATPPVS